MCKKTYFDLSAELNESLVISPEAFPITLSVIRTTKPWKNTTVEQKIDYFVNAVRMIRDLADGKVSMNKSMLGSEKSTVEGRLQEVVHSYSSAEHLSYNADAKEGYERDPLEIEAYHKALGNLVDVPRFLKVFEKHEKHSDFLKRKVAVAREFLPIAKAYEVAKTKVVSGRIPDPNAKPKEINPNRIDGTCSWCRRTIALTKDQRMVHHGYERPGWGMQTASCSGISYKCLEVSDEGLRAMLAAYTARLAGTRKELTDLPNLKQVVRKDRWSGKPTTYTPTDPAWGGLISEMERNLKNQIRQLEQNIPILQNEIKNWKPTEVKKQRGA
jgi:hypothetical protein